MDIESVRKFLCSGHLCFARQVHVNWKRLFNIIISYIRIDLILVSRPQPPNSVGKTINTVILLIWEVWLFISIIITPTLCFWQFLKQKFYSVQHLLWSIFKGVKFNIRACMMRKFTYYCQLAVLRETRWECIYHFTISSKQTVRFN